jgi:hypothetical protein
MHNASAGEDRCGAIWIGDLDSSLANPLRIFDLLRYVSAARNLQEMNRLYLEFDLKCWIKEVRSSNGV